MIFSTFAFGYCYYIPCTANIQQGEQKSKSDIDKAYNKLHSTMDDMKEEYEKQLEELKEQNKLLENYKAILSHSSLQYKKMVFLLQKFNKLQGNKNDLEGVKKWKKDF